MSQCFEWHLKALSQRGRKRAGDADQSFALLEENTLIRVKSHSSKEKKGLKNSRSK